MCGILFGLYVWYVTLFLCVVNYMVYMCSILHCFYVWHITWLTCVMYHSTNIVVVYNSLNMAQSSKWYL